MKDPFSVLGVSRDATDDQIKQAYRKLALELHPDRNPGNKEAEERFKEVSAAYDEIKDPAKRARVADDLAHGEARFDYGGPRTEHFHSMDDFLRAFHRSFQQRNKDFNVICQMTLEEALVGKEMAFTVRTNDGPRTITTTIPAGVDDGMRLRVSGGGDTFFKNLPPGDLYVIIRIIPHTRFQRLAQNLVVETEIDAFDAMLGTKVEIVTIDGQTLLVDVPAGVQPQQRLRVAGRGMPVMGTVGVRGDLIVIMHVRTPTNLTDEQKDLICRAKSLSSSSSTENSP